jgi:hypothetical protein
MLDLKHLGLVVNQAQDNVGLVSIPDLKNLTQPLPSTNVIL